MLVENVMTPADKLIKVSPMAKVREALELMKENGVHSIIVDKVSPYSAYGIITFKNIMQSIVAEDGDIDLLNIYDIASTPAISVSAHLDVKYASQMMVKNSIKRLLILDDNELQGILTMTDIVETLLEVFE